MIIFVKNIVRIEYNGDQFVSCQYMGRDVNEKNATKMFGLDRPHGYGGLTAHRYTALNAVLSLKQKYGYKSVYIDGDIKTEEREAGTVF